MALSTSTFASAAVSGHLDTRTAATEVADKLDATLIQSCDLLVLFASFHHRAAFEEASAIIRETIHPTVTIGATMESVLGEERELEGVAGLSALALRMPGATLHPWTSTPEDPVRISKPETVPTRVGIGDDCRAVIMLADPFSTPITRLLPALTLARGEDHPVVVIGGMASGASQPGHNALLSNDRVLKGGAVGVTIGGDIVLDTVVSQGCRPIGRPLVVTKVHQNIILELGGRKALEVVRDETNSLPPADRQLLGGGLLVGTVINEQKSHWGRGDFLVRNVLGVEQKAGGLVVGDLPRAGQTIQLHVRDAETAREDLQLLLDAQQLHDTPFGALVFSCNGRGKRLFGEPDHDLSIIRERLGNVPTAGCFAAGEIGPIGGRSFLHGHTASLVLFRAP